MIINKLTLNNFMCYYNHKTFDFSNGLNIILGHNGDGKSTIFTAFNWIFNQYSELELAEVYSKKKYHEILENESFDVYIECVITQYDDEYKILKCFTVTKNENSPKLSRIKEEIWIKDLNTGDKKLDYRSISKLTQQVFPEAFRNFSMFETETDALKIVEGQKLAELVKNFSNAKYYEKLDEVIEGFSERADKQFRRESKADKTASEAIDDIDKKIEEVKREIKKLGESIAEDEKGRNFYAEKISDLVKNLTISEDYKKIEEAIKKLISEIEKAREENKSRNRFTDKIFDEFYLLIGFNNIISGFSDKINKLRQEKNKVDNDERNKYAQEKLQLENGSTPFPPGFPSLEILEEILSDNICKICNTKLQENSKEYINKSISLYQESKKKEKEMEMPIIFPNNFIDEFQIIDRSIKLKPEKYSESRIKEEIEFGIDRITDNNSKIAKYQINISDLETEKKELMAKIPNVSEEELKNIRSNHDQYSREKDILVSKIAENTIKLENKITSLQELQKTRVKTLAQYKESDFKKSTVDVLSMLSEIAKNVKEEQYKLFLKVLSDRATSYLKQINVGEITGKIELYKKNDKEVAYKSLNEDNSMRSTLEDSGALQISKPLSILFAIADIASETADNENYPMIFDAPTGRYSPDREKEFFKVLKATKKQRIVVTLRFLGADDSNTPFVNNDYFRNIEKDKAFFIKRVRPFDKDKPETINTEIEILN
jgi:DNA sulfur modification protein DndD